MDEVAKIKEAITTQADSKPQAITKTETNLVFNEFNWLDIPNVKSVYAIAKVMAGSKMVPDSFKDDPFAVMIAMEIAGKMRMSLISVMQNLAVIKGKPGWLGSFVISLVNACGRFKPLHFVWFHNDKKDPNKVTGCCAQAVEIESGELIIGSPITEETVRGFGWDKKDNSMWNIPGQREQMFQYRAAAYFARAKCPEVLNGLYTKEELMDIANDYSGAEKVTINLGGNE